MRTKRILFRMMMLMVMVGVLSSCQRDVLISKREVRNLDLVKVETAERSIPNRPARMVAVEQQAQVATADAAESTTLTPAPEAISTPEATASAAVNVKSIRNIPAGKMARQAIRNTTQKAMDQVAATASPLVQPREKLNQNEKSELRKAGKKSNDVDLVRLILYLLAALLIITILNILFKGYFLSIVGLVLVILLIFWLLGMF